MEANKSQRSKAIEAWSEDGERGVEIGSGGGAARGTFVRGSAAG